MALLAGKTEIGLKDTSQTATVANDNRAKLMYYLNSICSALEVDDAGIARLRQYRRYQLTGDETDTLIVLCYLLSPDELIDKCLFQSDELCGDSLNKFYDLSMARTHLAVMDSIVIGGQRKQVKKIMAFKMAWIERYWVDPIKELMAERSQAKRREQQQLEERQEQQSLQQQLQAQQLQLRQQQRQLEALQKKKKKSCHVM